MASCYLAGLVMCGIFSSALGDCKTAGFGQNTDITGKVCPPNDVVHIVTSPSIVSCVSYCTNHDTCQSVFYSELDSSCTGCQGNYGDSSTLDDKPGTLYYSKRKCQVPLPSVAHVNVSQFNGDTNIGASFPYTCDPSCTYFPTPENDMISCQSDGTWSTPACSGIDSGYFSNGELIPDGAKGCASTYGSGICGGSVTDGYLLNGEIGDCTCEHTCCDWADCCFDANCDDSYPLQSFSSHSIDPTGMSSSIDPTVMSSSIDPTGMSSSFDPTGVSSSIDPTGMSPSFGPTDVSSSIDPTGMSSSFDPTGLSSSFGPTDVSSSFGPTGMSSSVVPTGVSSSFDPTDVFSSVDLTGVSSSFDPTDVFSSFDPTGLSSSFGPTDVSSSVVPTGVSSSFDPTGMSSSFGPTGVSSSVDLTGMSSSIVPTDVSSSVDPPLDSTDYVYTYDYNPPTSEPDYGYTYTYEYIGPPPSYNYDSTWPSSSYDYYR